MAPLLRLRTAERGFAPNVVERHSPQAGYYNVRLVESGAVHSASVPVPLERRDATSNPSNDSTQGTPSLAVSTQAMAGIIVFLGIVIIGLYLHNIYLGCNL